MEILGRGQFGAVNKALWQFKNCDRLEVSQEVAVKSLHDESSNEDKVKFLQEAAIMAQFNQPNILRVLGIINENEHKVSRYSLDGYNTLRILQSLIIIVQKT